MFQIVDGALIRQDQDACFFLCNDVNVTMTTDSSLVTSLQVDSGALKCTDYRTSQRCEGPVYYVQDKGKIVNVVDGSQSKWNAIYSTHGKSTYSTYVRRFSSSFDPSHVSDPSSLSFIPTGCAAAPISIPQWVMVVPIVVGLLLFAVIAIIAAKLIIVFLVRIFCNYIHAYIICHILQWGSVF